MRLPAKVNKMSSIAKSTLNCMVECLEVRLAMSAVGFVERVGADGPITQSFYVADIDNDDVDDLVALQVGAGGTNQIVWHQISDGDGTFNAAKTVGGPAVIRSLHLSDVDGDGDVDVLSLESVPSNGQQVVWYENRDGGDTFERRPILHLEAELLGQTDLAVEDFNGDGNADVLLFVSDLASANISEILWSQQRGASGEFTVPRSISSGGQLGGLIEVGDVDGDGDQDVIASFLNAPVVGGLQWFENNGFGDFATRQMLVAIELPALLPVQIEFVDFDRDGDLDLVLLAAILAERRILLYERLSPLEFAIVQELDSSISPVSIASGDLDADGDEDILVLDELGDAYFIKNEEGSKRILPLGLSEIISLVPVDADHDGDIDIITATMTGIQWQENRLVGDLDDNGVVEFADFLKLSNNFGNSNLGWSGGDLDADGLVGFSDHLLLANCFGSRRPPSA